MFNQEKIDVNCLMKYLLDCAYYVVQNQEELVQIIYHSDKMMHTI